MNIRGQEFTKEQLESLYDLCQELIVINEEQNAKLIAFDAKLKNEEQKVFRLSQQVLFLSQAFTGGTYKA
jgi:hypothetical protein